MIHVPRDSMQSASHCRYDGPLSASLPELDERIGGPAGGPDASTGRCMRAGCPARRAIARRERGRTGPGGPTRSRSRRRNRRRRARRGTGRGPPRRPSGRERAGDGSLPLARSPLLRRVPGPPRRRFRTGAPPAGARAAGAAPGGAGGGFFAPGREGPVRPLLLRRIVPIKNDRFTRSAGSAV